MANVNIYNMNGDVVGSMELNDKIFGAEVNKSVLHSVVRAYLLNQRQGTQSTLTRTEVSGGGKKPWRQKGTGRASFGSSRNPVWRGGGVAFGPVPHGHEISMPKKMRRAALFSALSSKLAEGKLIVVDELEFAAPKTKEMARVLGNLDARNALVVLGENSCNAALSARNMPGVCTVSHTGLNTYNVLYHDKLVLTKDALALFEEVYA